MSLLARPVVRGIPGPKGSPQYSANFTYEFFGDAPTPQSLGGLNFTGSVYSFDASAISTSSNLPSFRSLQFSQTFNSDDTAGNDLDGELIIYIASTGQLVRVPTQQASVDHTKLQMVTGVIPIVANRPTQIQFGKRANANTAGLMYGKLIATLFTFDVQPWIVTGNCSVD